VWALNGFGTPPWGSRWWAGWNDVDAPQATKAHQIRGLPLAFPDDRGDRFGHGLGLLERASGWRVGVENVADVAVVFGVCRSAAVTLGVRQ